jgi:hypothetical protein
VKRWIWVATVGVCAGAPAQLLPPTPTPQGAAAAGTQQGVQAEFQSGMDALRRHDPTQAMEAFRRAATENPQSYDANMMAASTALSLWQPREAITFGERAQAIDPADWRVATTLVAAYQMVGDKTKRDAERNLLDKAHGADPHGEAQRVSGFLEDRFRVGAYTVDGVEYFAPVGANRIYYRFVVQAKEGGPRWNLDVMSDARNQASWAAANPDKAAAGERQFQLAGADGTRREEYQGWTGRPDFDEVKGHITAMLRERTAPFPGQQ